MEEFARFEVGLMPQHLPRKTEENHEKISHYSLFPGRDLDLDIST